MTTSEDDINKENQDSQSGKAKRVREIYGSVDNIARLGSPVDRSSSGGSHIRYYFYPTWRSQLFLILGYFCLCIAVVWVCRLFPQVTIVKGRLLSYGSHQLDLFLPWPIFFPGFVLGKVLLYIYNSKYIIDERGVEAQIGLVSLNLRQPRLRYEDIRGIEPQQTLWERILGIGSVLIGSAMTQDVEIVMTGVSNPRAIQLLISGERDKRLKRIHGSSLSRRRAAEAVELVGD